MTQVKWIKQTKNTCGQTCVAMLAGIALDESIKVFGKRGGTSTKMVHNALKKLGFDSPTKLLRVKRDTVLPNTCIVKITWYDRNGKKLHYGHWCLYYEGKFYDPSIGVYEPDSYETVVLESFGKITSYLPIYQTGGCINTPLSSPILEGEDADRFWEEVTRERTPEEIERQKQFIRQCVEIFAKHGPPRSSQK